MRIAATEKEWVKYSTQIIDTGYTKVCAHCSSRFASEPRLINTPREITIEKCEKCKCKNKSWYEKNFA